MWDTQHSALLRQPSNHSSSVPVLLSSSTQVLVLGRSPCSLPQLVKSTGKSSHCKILDWFLSVNKRHFFVFLSYCTWKIICAPVNLVKYLHLPRELAVEKDEWTISPPLFVPFLLQQTATHYGHLVPGKKNLKEAILAESGGSAWTALILNLTGMFWQS